VNSEAFNSIYTSNQREFRRYEMALLIYTGLCTCVKESAVSSATVFNFLKTAGIKMWNLKMCKEPFQNK